MSFMTRLDSVTQQMVHMHWCLHPKPQWCQNGKICPPASQYTFPHFSLILPLKRTSLWLCLHLCPILWKFMSFSLLICAYPYGIQKETSEVDENIFQTFLEKFLNIHWQRQFVSFSRFIKVLYIGKIGIIYYAAHFFGLPSPLLSVDQL